MNKKIAVVVTLMALGIPGAQSFVHSMSDVDVLGAVQAGALALMVMGMLIPDHPRSHGA